MDKHKYISLKKHYAALASANEAHRQNKAAAAAEAYERGLKDGRLQQQRSDDSRQVEARARALEALGHIAEAVAKVTEPRTF